MARPIKAGLSYYPMDVGFLRDKKVKLLMAEFGASSVVFVLYVLGKVYEEDGYFLRWDRDELLLAAKEIGESPAYISEVLQGCLSRSLFDEGVFQVFQVLTSAGIQRRYLTGCEKRADIKIYREYWLLNECDEESIPAGIRAKLTFFEVSGGKNPVNSPGNSVNSPGNPTKESKENKRKEKKDPCPERTGSASGPGDEDAVRKRGFCPELEEAVLSWLRYKRERREEYRPTGLTKLLSQIEHAAQKHGAAAVVDVMEKSMSANYQGIIWSWLRTSAEKSPQGAQWKGFDE